MMRYLEMSIIKAWAIFSYRSLYHAYVIQSCRLQTFPMWRLHLLISWKISWSYMDVLFDA